MEYKTIIFEKENNFAVITLNRPDKLNALNRETLEELERVFRELKNDNGIYAVILTGKGEKAFAAGADISELNKLNAVEGRKYSEYGQKVFNRIENLGKPVIAAVNGFALGGGCEIAMACHIRLASENAKFGQPEVNLGIIPGFGGTQRLARLINPARAMEYILTGDMITADQAYLLGLVNHVYAAEELMDKAKELAAKISSKGQVAVRHCVEAVVKTAELPQKEGQAYEASLFGITCSTEDFKEGTAAFLEKRKPAFKLR